MSSTGVSSLSAGLQQLYNNGLLPSSLSTSTLNSSSATQLNRLATTSLSLQEIGAVLGEGTDSATLSSTASNALLQEINPSSSSTSTATDPLTAAVNNQLTSSLNAAVSKFLPQSSSSGSINVLG